MRLSLFPSVMCFSQHGSSGARRAGLAGRAALAAFFAAALAWPAPVQAAGTYAEGSAVVRITQFEQSGLVWTSWEGQLEWAGYDESEDCDEARNECYTPELATRKFSLDPDNADAADFVRRNVGKQMLIRYRIHLVEPVSLDSDFEILEARVWDEAAPAGLPPVRKIEPTGAARNFSVYGRVLRLERRGNAVKTWEGLYYNQQTGKVHPFSLTDDGMASYLLTAMGSSKMFYLGVSVAYVAAVRETGWDIVEVNYNEPASF